MKPAYDLLSNTSSIMFYLKKKKQAKKVEGGDVFSAAFGQLPHSCDIYRRSVTQHFCFSVFYIS